MPFEFIQQALQQRQQAQLSRRRQPLCREVIGDPRLLTNGDASYLDFSSNDYLALSSEPKVIKAAVDALEKYGVGSGGSPLVTGYHPLQQALEQYLADWLGYDSCLLFSAGFAANTGIIQTLMADSADLLIQDKLNHASLIDAGRCCGAKSLRFVHNNVESLQRQLQTPGNNKLVVTEGVFSMDGDSAPLSQIARATKQADSWLMVDDAHGFGVLGEQGKGSANAAGLAPQQLDIYMATFGKAVGTCGAFVAGSASTIEYLLQFCRHYTYSTAMPPAMIAATLASLQLLAQQQWRRDKLTELIEHFKMRMAQIGLGDNGSNSPIMPIVIGDTAKTVHISEQLKQVGIWLTAIRPPTVPANTARLRVTLSCRHETQDIDRLFTALEPLL